MKNVTAFSHREHGSRRVLSEVKNALFRKLTARSSNLFVRGGDVISVGPQANALHEPDLTSLIDHCSKSGYNDFLIDIGANIGLTTAQSGALFSKIICFEPNPLCVHVLKVNINIAGVDEKSEVCEYGLGAEEGEYQLWIPRHNWGGAFVKSSENSYSNELLISKDGLLEFLEENYITKKIQIKSACLELNRVFNDLLAHGLNRGVIKIDVEGMEGVVLRGIADALIPDIKMVILFENWSEDFDHQKVVGMFGGRNVSMFHLSYRKPFKKEWHRALKAAALMLRPTELHLEAIEHSRDRTGDIVIVVN